MRLRGFAKPCGNSSKTRPIWTGARMRWVIACSGMARAMSEITRRAQPIRLPAESEQSLRAKPLVFMATLMVRPGANTVSIGVIDEVSNTQGFAHTRIVAR